MLDKQIRAYIFISTYLVHAKRSVVPYFLLHAPFPCYVHGLVLLYLYHKQSMMSNASPVVWRKSYASTDGHHVGSPPVPMSPSLSANAAPIGIQKRRQSSFNSLYSPYTRRRSFLSKTMIENESVQCYKLSSYSSISSSLNENIPSYSISLSESQGFLWNQDLFASSYQQSEAGVHNMMSMSDGSYYLGGSGRSRNNEISQDHNSDSPLVDVIDVVIGNDDYNSDVELVTEVVKVGNYGEDDEDDEEDDEDDEDEHDVGDRDGNTANKVLGDTLSANGNRDTGLKNIQHDECKYTNGSRDSSNEDEDEDEEDEDIFVSDL